MIFFNKNNLKKKHLRLLLLFFFKLIIGLGAVFYLYRQHGLKNVLLHFFSDYDFDFLLIVAGLSLINWFLEIKKWQYLVSQVHKIDFWKAAYQSLTGFAVSMLTPNRVGEYGAKVLFFEPSLRKKIFSLSIIGNMSQLLATLLFGLFGFIVVLKFHLIVYPKMFRIPYLSIILIILLGLLVYIAYKKYIFQKNLIINNSQIWWRSFLFAVLRYLVFAGQFFLFFKYFHTNVNSLTLLAGITLTYLLSTLVPMLAFLDWTVKGSIGVWVFEQLGLNDTVVLKIILSTWSLNFFIPFLIGVILFIVKIKKQSKLN